MNLKKVCEEIAAILTASPLPGRDDLRWVSKPVSSIENTNIYITRSDGLKLLVCLVNQKLSVSYSRPNYRGQRFEMHTQDGKRVADPIITISIKQTQMTMASEISRRLLPDAEYVDALSREKIALYTQSDNGTKSAVISMSEMSGIQRPRKLDDERQKMVLDPDGVDLEICHTPHLRGLTGNIHVNSGGKTVDFSINSLPLAEAKVLASFLRRKILTPQSTEIVVSCTPTKDLSMSMDNVVDV